jgi:hypothetical protein
MPIELLLFGIFLSALITLTGVIKARNTKQRFYYLLVVDGLLMILIFSLGFISQFMLSLIFIVILGVFCYLTLPISVVFREKELIKERQKIDASSPLTVRDFFSDAFWLKLMARHGFWKSFGFYLIFLASIAGVILIISLIISQFSISSRHISSLSTLQRTSQLTLFTSTCNSGKLPTKVHAYPKSELCITLPTSLI